MSAAGGGTVEDAYESRGFDVLARRCGKMVKKEIRCIPGDRVTVELAGLQGPPEKPYEHRWTLTVLRAGIAPGHHLC